ncbi:MAG TPA: non-homologous end-joining DNA ligase [Polyangiaceae bacterium]|nr:non-homologous end-joining DNA ligase [Polyangiaceae bacterium]
MRRPPARQQPSPPENLAVNAALARITTPARPAYPELGLTKIDVARYYADVAAWMLPYVADRPLTLVRCEHGARSENALRSDCKFLRHGSGWHRWAHPSIRRVQIPEQKKVGEYLVVSSEEGLVSLIQGDVLEVHCWNSTTRDLERPDRFVFDLDPDPGLPFGRVLEAALALRALLARIGLQSWPKLTGGKGLHVVVPFEPDLDWTNAYAFSRVLAETLVKEHRHSLTLQFEKVRRSGKILIDYKRNHRAATAVAAYSTRAHRNAALSVPVAWDELHAGLTASTYTLCNVRQRLAALNADPWNDFWACRQSLTARLQHG